MKNPFENPMKKSFEGTEEAPEEKAQFTIDEEGIETFSIETTHTSTPEDEASRSKSDARVREWRKEHGGD